MQSEHIIIYRVLYSRRAVEALKLHFYTIRRLCSEGKILAFKFGGQWRFRKSEIEAWGVKKNKKY